MRLGRSQRDVLRGRVRAPIVHLTALPAGQTAFERFFLPFPGFYGIVAIDMVTHALLLGQLHDATW